MSGKDKSTGDPHLLGGVSRETLEILEWSRIEERLSHHCATEMGRLFVSSLKFHTNLGTIRKLLEENRQMRNLIDTDKPLEIRYLPLLEDVIDSAMIGGSLSADGIVSILKALNTVLQIVRYFSGRKGKYPFLAKQVREIPPINEIRDKIAGMIDESGEVRDSASPEIGPLRRRATEARERVMKTTREIISSLKYGKFLQDTYVTMRNGRHVLPFRISAARQMKGILHETSQTKQTIFFEPEELVHANNILKTSESELAEEIRKILLKISKEVGEKGKEIKKAVGKGGDIDLIKARALLSVEMGGREPRLEEGYSLDLIDCRHPILVLKKKEVVPNRVQIGGNTRSMVVTGPNAGGKTVLIKTVGLLVLMTMAGLSIPAHGDSLMSPFKDIFIALGDMQSVEQDLSTFTADILKLKNIYDRTSEGTLVLLDEVITGTDPKEGSALGRAYLRTLVERGGILFATTHYDDVKYLPLEDRRFVVASMGFSMEDLSPTFTLSVGTPGPSMGILIAKKIGFPGEVIERARAHLGEGEGKIQALIEDLSLRKEKIEEKGKRLDQEMARVQEEGKRISREKDALSSMRDKIVKEAHARAAAVAAKAEDEIERIMAELKKEKKVELVRKAKDVMREIKGRTAEVVHSPTVQKTISATMPVRGGEELEKGQRVFVISLGREGFVESESGGKVKILLGSVTTLTNLSDLRVFPSKVKETRKADSRYLSTLKGDSLLVKSSSNTIDIRGLDSEEAVKEVDLFLDRAYLRDRQGIFVIHGHGGGVLKKKVREYLKNSPYISSFSPAPENQGGDGVTIVKLK
jgi:DNA mismatch repair protein MutS2